MDLMRDITYDYSEADIKTQSSPTPTWNESMSQISENDLVLLVRGGRVTVMKNRYGCSGVLTNRGVLKTFLLMVRDSVCETKFFNEVLGMELFEAVNNIMERYRVTGEKKWERLS